jgi:DNA-binding PadR family transcriptional regulator
VLTALAADPSAWRYGYELGQQVGLKAGSLYPILMRLSDRGLLEASWESGPPQGRPPRHLYRLTGDGVLAAEEFTRAEGFAPVKGFAPAKGFVRGRGSARAGGDVRGARRQAGLGGAW